MKYKSMIILILTAFVLLSIAGVSAVDVDDKAIASENIDLSQNSGIEIDNLLTTEEDTPLTPVSDEEIITDNETDADSGKIVLENNFADEDIADDNGDEIQVDDNIKYYADGSPVNNTDETDTDGLIDLSECATAVLRVSDTESVISFRRDATNAADISIVGGKWGHINFVKQYKTAAGYFFQVIVTENGWLIGDGGVTDGSRNRQIESIVSEMVTKKVINDNYLKKIYNIFGNDELGHFVIMAPNGTYGVVFTDRYHVSKLEPGEFVLCPNLYSKSQKGTYDHSINPVDAAIKVIYTDSFGVNRRNVITYHYNANISSGQKIDVYASNDNGAGVGRSTAGLADDIYFFGKYHSKSSLPLTPKKVKLGTHIFGIDNADKEDLTIEATANPIVLGENATVVVTGLKNATGNISVRAGDGIYISPIVDGTASVVIPGLIVDTIAEIHYGGDDNYNPTDISITVIVSNFNITEISADPITTIYNINKYLVVTLTDGKGNALSDFNLTVNLNGSKNYATDGNGQIKVSTKGLAPHVYTATITFGGSEYYANSTKNVHVTVKKATPKIIARAKTFKSTAKTKKYTITLKNNIGKAIKKATVKFKINGKTYTAKTNGKGVATYKLKLNKNRTYKGVVTYKGNKYYNKLTKKVKITVKSTSKRH